MVKTLRFHCRGGGSIPGQGTSYTYCKVWPKKKKPQDGLFSPILRLICDKFHPPATNFSFQICVFKL